MVDLLRELCIHYGFYCNINYARRIQHDTTQHSLVGFPRNEVGIGATQGLCIIEGDISCF